MSSEMRPRRSSHFRIRVTPPSVMLVRVDADTEASMYLEDAVHARMLRVRHPLPACQRMAVTRPLVVIVGASVREQDCALLIEQARAIGAAIVQLGPLVPRAAVGGWLQQAIQVVQKRRAAAEAEAEQEQQAQIA